MRCPAPPTQHLHNKCAFHFCFPEESHEQLGNFIQEAGRVDGKERRKTSLYDKGLHSRVSHRLSHTWLEASLQCHESQEGNVIPDYHLHLWPLLIMLKGIKKEGTPACHSSRCACAPVTKRDWPRFRTKPMPTTKLRLSPHFHGAGNKSRKSTPLPIQQEEQNNKGFSPGTSAPARQSVLLLVRLQCRRSSQLANKGGGQGQRRPRECFQHSAPTPLSLP